MPIYLLMLEAAFTWGEFSRHHQGRNIVIFVDSLHAEVPSPGVAVFIGFAAQAKLVWCESTEASALHTDPFGFNPGDATGAHGAGV